MGISLRQVEAKQTAKRGKLSYAERHKLAIQHHKKQFARSEYDPVSFVSRTRINLFGILVQQSLVSIAGIEEVLNIFKPQVILEIGSGFGALTTYLGVWAAINNAEVYSIEINDNLVEKAKKVWGGLPINYYAMDEFSKEWLDIVTKKILVGKSCKFVFCDGADKVRELKIYESMLDKGDILGTHDWVKKEANKKICDYLTKKGFNSFKRVMWEDMNAGIMFWRKEMITNRFVRDSGWKT